MKLSFLPLIALSLVCGVAAAQNATSTPPSQQGDGSGPGSGGAGRGGFGGMRMGMMPGSGFIGTVTEVAADHYKVKTESGEVYTVHFSVNTRFVKQPAGARGDGPRRRAGSSMGTGSAGGTESDAGGGTGPAAIEGGTTSAGRTGGRAYTPPEPIKPTDIKVGDAVGAMGEVDASAKSVGAVVIMQLNPERAQQMEKMQASYGKTWLMGKVSAIDGVKVTVAGAMDNQPIAFVADENTSFRKRREPITLADIQIGDTVRAEGALKNGVFTAATVSVMGMPPAGTRNLPPGPPPQ